MKTKLQAVIFLALIVALPHATASNVWFTGTVKKVYPLSNGAVVVMFNEDNSNCSNTNSPDKYVSVR